MYSQGIRTASLDDCNEAGNAEWRYDRKLSWNDQDAGTWLLQEHLQAAAWPLLACGQLERRRPA